MAIICKDVSVIIIYLFIYGWLVGWLVEWFCGTSILVRLFNAKFNRFVSSIGQMNRVFTVWSGRPGFNPRSSHIKDSKMVLDSVLLNTQLYKVRIKGKVALYKEWSSALPNTSCVKLLKSEPLGHLILRSPTLLTFYRVSETKKICHLNVFLFFFFSFIYFI